MLFKQLTDTKWATTVFILAMSTVYLVLPAFVNEYFLPNPFFIQLAQLTGVACLSVWAGYAIPILDNQLKPGAPRITASARTFHIVVWSTFLVFVLITFATANAIPLVSAFKGASPEELTQQRGDFLKTRSGMEAGLIYLSTLFVSALLPYSLALQFINKSKFRFALLLLFLLYSMSFLQKALFVNVLFPLLYLAARSPKANVTRVIFIVLTCVFLLYAITQLALGGADTPEALLDSNTDYFVATYLPSNPIEHLIWRSTAVPMFSASDTLLVHSDQFGGQLLWGATSSFFAVVLGLQPIPMERLVAEYQWGWSDIANTNSVYITEAFINFGWPGAILLSMFVGQALRWFRKSEDQAFKSLWLIFCFAIFNAGLIGTLLSNGYLAIFFIALYIKFTSPKNSHE